MGDVATYQAAVQACALARALLEAHDLEGLLRDIDRAETVGPILDPTLWIQKSGAMARDKALLQAALRFASFRPEASRG